ncbi:hypothetical protein BX666DRAFT_2022237 [Dichotomocladium elegans]|nr:hypothetical protein BX666DRAFT_2022237 [Dichotomocladium elegans]
MHLTMNEGLLAKHTHLNGGALPTSPEDLAQKHHKLLQDYSRYIYNADDLNASPLIFQSSLKAQFTVLKKAVIKLQEELDLLSFHNERLTKRIEAVQEAEQKGTHFSLLGGAVKKELERSTQALNAMNVDLAKKIEENERLHDELSENRHIYTDHINGLHLQIGKLEKLVEESQVEISSLQKDSRDQAMVLKQEKAALQAELTALKKELENNSKSRTLKESESIMKQGDIDLRSEIESLRAILMAKLGDVEGHDDDEERDLPKLADVIPACEALKILEDQAKDYIYALREQTSLKGLPHELAAKLKLSSKTWSEEMQQLARRLEESEGQVKNLLEAAKIDSAQAAEKVVALEATIQDLRAELNNQQKAEQILELQNAKADLEKRNEVLGKRNAELEDIIKKLEVDLNDVRMQLDQAITSRLQLEEAFAAKEATMMEQLKGQADTLAQAKLTHKQVDMESQTEYVTETSPPQTKTEKADKGSQTEFGPELVQDASTKTDTNDEEDDDVFVYRSTETADNLGGLDDDDDDDEDVFIYRGEDAAEENASGATTSLATAAGGRSPLLEGASNLQEHQTTAVLDTCTTAVVAKDALDDYKAREAAMEAYYQNQIKRLTEQLSLADSKARRYSKLIHTLKDRLMTEAEQRIRLEQDNEKIHKELDRVKEHLETTEKNYQAQISTMTLEFLGQGSQRGSLGP